MQKVITHEARELFFYAMNREPRCNWLECSIRKITTLHKSGKLNRALALRLLENNGRDAARQYVRDHCAKGDKWHDIFDVTSRQQFAALVLQRIIGEAE